VQYDDVKQRNRWFNRGRWGNDRVDLGAEHRGA
jgi:hypothetical protein